MGSAASLLPQSEEEALARGFTQEQIVEFKEILHRHAKIPEGSGVGIANSMQQSPPSVEHTSSRASSVFASAGLSSLGSKAAQARQQVDVLVNNMNCAVAASAGVTESHLPNSASATLLAQPRPSQRTNTINRRSALPHPVFPASASADTNRRSVLPRPVFSASASVDSATSIASVTSPAPSTRSISSASAVPSASGTSTAPNPLASYDCL